MPILIELVVIQSSPLFTEKTGKTMANIKLKPISDLSNWTPKELRKLRMIIKNRLSAFELNSDPKELPETHPLHDMEPGEIKVLLDKVLKAEK